MKRIYIVWFVLAIGSVCFALLVVLALGAKGKDSVMTSTETEPIYNHFPDLPKTSEIKWCSQSSGGIGLVTTTLYIFSFYNEDISDTLQGMTIDDKAATIELYYEPEEVRGQKWRLVENAAFAFQTGIKDTKKMYTNVYLNASGTILYVEAVGD